MDPTPASQRQECRRCGSFAPALDRDGVCDDCVHRLTELERVPPSFGNVLLGAVLVPVKLGLPALLLVVVAAAPIYLIRHLDMYVPLVGWAVDVLAQGVLLVMAHRLIQGRRVELTTSAQITFDHWAKLLLVAFLCHLQIGLLLVGPSFVALFVVVAVPGEAALVVMVLAWVLGLGLALWRASSLALALPIAQHEDKTGLSALAESARRTKGNRAPALVFALAGLLWLLVPLVLDTVVFLLGIGIAATEVLDPSVAERFASTLDAIGPPIEIGGLALTSLMMICMTSVSAVLYAKTVRYRVY